MSHAPINTLILTGRPGSGKGTQAVRLSRALGWTHFSTGDRFRALREGDSPLSANVRASYDAGKLLPDWFATYLFQDALFRLREGEGMICEGYPRSPGQAEAFGDMLAWLERPYVAVDLDVPEEVAIARMLQRAQVEDRPDSGTEAQARARLATYDEHTAPVLAYFEGAGSLRKVDGTLPPEGVEAAIREALGIV